MTRRITKVYIFPNYMPVFTREGLLFSKTFKKINYCSYTCSTHRKIASNSKKINVYIIRPMWRHAREFNKYCCFITLSELISTYYYSALFIHIVWKVNEN